MYNEAIDEINQAIQLSGGDTRARATLGHAFAVAGRRDDAIKVLNDLKTLSKERYVSPYYMALIYVGLGDERQAVAWLEKASAERESYLILMKAEPVFDRLRSDPGFQAIERRVGLTP
jgi:tetratricopeptide (TPR) repeat protein